MMLNSIKQALLMLFFGTNVAITPTPINLTTGETIIHAPKSIKPTSDTIQILMSIGVPNKEIKRQITYGEFVEGDVGVIDVEICESEKNCAAMQYGGPFFSNDAYGLLYAISDKKIRGKAFSVVKIRTSKSINGITMRWQNYSK